MSSYLIIGLLVSLWKNIHEKAMGKSSINWAKCHDARKIKNAVVTLGIMILGILFLPLMFFFPEFQVDSNYTIKLSIISLIFFLYIIYCDYIFITSKSNALFHVRVLFILIVCPLILFVFKNFSIQYPNEICIGSYPFWATLTITLIILFLIACIILIIILTYKDNIKIIFSKDGIKIRELDIFLGLIVTFLMVCFSFLDHTPFLNLYSSSEIRKQETQPIKEIGKSINDSVTFRPQNATIVDFEGSHDFGNFDCPNMLVTDNGNSVNIAWGGDKLTLFESENNNDTYMATDHTSRGKATLRAFRSSSSGKIYLIIATMQNPTPDVQHITINFKP